nr:hypothetical protein [Pedobacter sp. ASV19]
MKYLIYLFSILLCFTTPLIGFAQTELTDSLTTVLKSPSLGEKEKPVLLNQLAEIYRTNKNYGLAERKASESARIALQNKDYIDAVKAYTQLVNIRTSTGQLSLAKRTSDSTSVLAKKANDPVAMAYAYYAQVLVYKILDDAQNVVKFCGLALKQLEKKSDPYIASKIYYRLYAVYSGWNNEAKANLYASKATENVLLTSDYNHLSNCYTALSVAHEYNYNTSKNKAELDSVLFYLKKSEMLYHQYPLSLIHI